MVGKGGFETYLDRCWQELRSNKFVWPDGVTSVDLGFGEPVTIPGLVG